MSDRVQKEIVSLAALQNRIGEKNITLDFSTIIYLVSQALQWTENSNGNIVEPYFQILELYNGLAV